MAKASSAILDGLAAAYRVDLDGGTYVRELIETIAPALDGGLGVVGYTYDARDPSQPVIEHLACSQRFDPAWLLPYRAAVTEAELDETAPDRPTSFHVWNRLTCGQASAVPQMRPFLPLFHHLGGARDAFAVNAFDASGHGLWFAAPFAKVGRPSAERMTLFTRFAAHLTTALRVRRTAGASTPEAAATLSPTGALLDAAGGDSVVEAREALRRATLAFDKARAATNGGGDDLEPTTRRWRPLVAARWSLLDEHDTDGRRFVVAVESSPPTRAPRRDLSEREHQVMTQAHLGHSDKAIAYELGLSASTVRVLLHRAAQKLGASTRREALERFDALAKLRPDDRAGR